VPSFGRWTREVIWFVAMALFMSVFTRIDALMIRNLSPNLMGLVGLDSGYFQAGIYAQSYRLLDAGLIFSTLLSTQLLPIFSKNIKEGKDNTVFVWLSFRLVWLVGLTALFTAYIFGDDILELLYGAKWEGGPETALAVFGAAAPAHRGRGPATARRSSTTGHRTSGCPASAAKNQSERRTSRRQRISKNNNVVGADGPSRIGHPCEMGPDVARHRRQVIPSVAPWTRSPSGRRRD
jgi:hypothetical protein